MDVNRLLSGCKKNKLYDIHPETQIKNAPSGSETVPRRDLSASFGQVKYVLFWVLALYFIVAKGDVATAASNMGIALIFDPFPGKTWTQRLRWQRAWLIIYLVAVLVLLGWAWMK